jgi:hypothetical protein
MACGRKVFRASASCVTLDAWPSAALALSAACSIAREALEACLLACARMDSWCSRGSFAKAFLTFGVPEWRGVECRGFRFGLFRLLVASGGLGRLAVGLGRGLGLDFFVLFRLASRSLDGRSRGRQLRHRVFTDSGALSAFSAGSLINHLGGAPLPDGLAAGRLGRLARRLMPWSSKASAGLGHLAGRDGALQGVDDLLGHLGLGDQPGRSRRVWSGAMVSSSRRACSGCTEASAQ